MANYSQIPNVSIVGEIIEMFTNTSKDGTKNYHTIVIYRGQGDFCPVAVEKEIYDTVKKGQKVSLLCNIFNGNYGSLSVRLKEIQK